MSGTDQQPLPELIAATRNAFTGEEPATLLSPYRINPLGAHVDHQGGNVLAQTIDQYTILSFQPATSATVRLRCMHSDWEEHTTEFKIGDNSSKVNWVRYAQGACSALNDFKHLEHGIDAVVAGTLIGAGLSSSASVILAYLMAVAIANKLTLSKPELVELARVVENQYMGLNNGIQDQMSIVYGDTAGLAHLNMKAATASLALTPTTAANLQSCWVILFSGYTRELINSGFNTRVAECRKAAAALTSSGAGASDVQTDSVADTLGDVPAALRTDANLARIDPLLAKRARHFFSETARVAQGVEHWVAGHWQAFGQLMNESCSSSIEQYESGSQALIDAHQIAKTTEGVFGSRFGGGGYGGCLIMLCDSDKADAICQSVLQDYLRQHPDRAGIARCFKAQAVPGIRQYQPDQKTS